MIWTSGDTENSDAESPEEWQPSQEAGKFKKSLDLKEKDVLILTLVDTGTHADLFNL